MEQRHQKKNENLWNSREELTCKNLAVMGIEQGVFQTGVNLNN